MDYTKRCRCDMGRIISSGASCKLNPTNKMSMNSDVTIYKSKKTKMPEFDRAHQAFNPYALRQLPRGEAMVRIASAEGELVEMHPDSRAPPSAPRAAP